jgi:hypothetical protein
MKLRISTGKLLALTSSLFLGVMTLGANAQSAADYPNKTIELVVPFGAGNKWCSCGQQLKFPEHLLPAARTRWLHFFFLA